MFREETARAFAIKPIIICPALIFAISRTLKVIGRIQILRVSIKISKGTRGAGAPDGAKCADDSTGNLIHPERIKRVQKTRAKEIATQIFLVALYTNGTNPKRLSTRRNPKSLYTNRLIPGSDFCGVSELVDKIDKKIFELDCPHEFDTRNIPDAIMGIDQRRVDIQPICIQSNAENKSVNINI
jgi:hypothetical protein